MFKQYLRKNWVALACCVVTLKLALMWFAMRPVWSGISKVLGAESNPTFFVMELPLLICIFLWLVFVFSVVSLVFLKKKLTEKSDSKPPLFYWGDFVCLGIFVVFFIGIIVIFSMGGYDYLTYVLADFFTYVVVATFVALFAMLLFFPPIKNCKKCKILKTTLLCLVILATILLGFDIRLNYITYQPVVYAVEDNYQIVFSTNTNSIAWVEIDGKNYYDTFAGSMQSNRIVHKIEVPQADLDSAEGYTIFAQTMIYRGAFGGYKGKIMQKSYAFRPVDTSNGLQYYSLSDVHGALKGAVNAAKHFTASDFIVIAGDIVSMMDTHADANFVNTVAHQITKGEMPVIYARGNHEVKGRYAEYFHNYVGAKGTDFFYTVSFDDVYAIVLDIGEDHEDDWWEFYGTAQFDIYRQRQTEMLLDIEKNVDLTGFKYKLAVSHIPIVFVNNRKDHETFKNAWTEILNRLDIDMCISGHQHALYPLVPTTAIQPLTKLTYNEAYAGSQGKTYDGYLTDANFPNILVSKRSDTQLGTAQVVKKDQFIGLITTVNFTSGSQVSSYTNATGNKIPVVHPFANINFGTDIETTLRSR